MRSAAGVAVAVLGGVLLSGCGNAASDQDRQSTVHFTAPEFSIDTPGHPKQDKQTISTAAGPLEITTYSVEFEDSAVSMSVVPVPEGATVDLEGAVDGVVRNTSGKLVESEEIEYAGYEGRDARISSTFQGDGVTGFMRILDIDGSLLQLVNVVREAGLEKPPKSWTTMLDSLEIG